MLIIVLWLYVCECRGFDNADTDSDSASAQVGGQVRSGYEHQTPKDDDGDGYDEESSLKELHRLKHVLENEGIER